MNFWETSVREGYAVDLFDRGGMKLWHAFIGF